MSDENGNNAMSFVGRYENLASDMEVVFAKLGVSGKKLPKKNSSHHKHYSAYYNPESRKLIANRFKRDIDFFGYQFEAQI